MAIKYESIPKNKGVFNIKRELFNDVTVPWHVHAEYELTYISMASGSKHIGSHFNIIDSDEVLLVGPYLPHNWQRTRNDPDFRDNHYTDYQICIHFDADLFGKEFFELSPFQGIKELLKKAEYGLSFKGESIGHIRETMSNMLGMNEFDKCISLLSLLRYLAGLSNQKTLSTYGFRDKDNAEKANRMDNVIQYITDNCNKEITLKDLSQIANMTPQAFCAYFRNRTGKSPKAFINEVRIANACMMLYNEQASILSICYSTGFNTLCNFNRQFKKVTGVSPLTFRKRIRNEAPELVNNDVDMLTGFGTNHE